MYSLGAVLYELLVGELPLDFGKLPLDEVLRRLRNEDVPRPSTKLRTVRAKSHTAAQNRSVDIPTLPKLLKGDTDAIVRKALDKEPARPRLGSRSSGNDCGTSRCGILFGTSRELKEEDDLKPLQENPDYAPLLPSCGAGEAEPAPVTAK